MRALAKVLVILASLLIDAAFIHADAQEALILVFLPVYQWLLIGVLRGIASVWSLIHAA